MNPDILLPKIARLEAEADLLSSTLSTTVSDTLHSLDLLEDSVRSLRKYLSL